MTDRSFYYYYLLYYYQGDGGGQIDPGDRGEARGGRVQLRARVRQVGRTLQVRNVSTCFIV